MGRAPLLIIALVCALHLVGCASQQTTAKIMIVDGCLVTIEGLSSQQADMVMRDWDLNTDCEIEVKTKSGGKATRAELAEIKKELQDALEAVDASVKYKKGDEE